MHAEDTFDGQDRVMSRVAYDLQVRAATHSAFCSSPKFVPGGYLAVLGTQTTITAAELCTVGMWELIDGGYRYSTDQLSKYALTTCASCGQKTTMHPPGSVITTSAPGGLRRDSAAAGANEVTGRTRFGERIGQAAAAGFRCAACGAMAAVVKVARAGTTVNIMVTGKIATPFTCPFLDDPAEPGDSQVTIIKQQPMIAEKCCKCGVLKYASRAPTPSSRRKRTPPGSWTPWRRS
jgi:transcription elongation factor Elf1